MAIPNSLCDRELAKFQEDASGLTAVNVTASSPLPVTLDGGSVGVITHLTGSTVTDGTTQTLISTTVAVGKTLNLSKVAFSSTMDGKGTIEVAGSVVGSVRISAGVQNPEFIWNPIKAATTGQLVEIKFTAFSPGKATDVEAYLMATEI